MAQPSPADIQKYLGGMDFPANKDQLIEHASRQGADQDMLQTLRDLPRDSFGSANEISEAMSGM